VSKGELTRARILDEALVLASRLGLEGLTLGVLAENLGLSKSGLYAHFRSKEALVLAVIDHTKARHLEHSRPYLEGKPPGIEQVRAYFESWLDWTALPSLPAGCPLMGAAFEFEDIEGRARAAIVDTLCNSRNYLANFLKRAIGNHEIAAAAPIEQFLFEMRGIVLSFHIEHRLLHDPMARARAQSAFDALLTRYAIGDTRVGGRAQ
jgi:AcrR family transcriptional regulator